LDSKLDKSNTASQCAQPVPVRTDLFQQGSFASPSDRSVAKRRLRKHFVLNVIREHGPISRAEIAKISGLNLPSVSSLVDELISDQLAVEEEARAAVRGRRPIPVRLCSNAASIVGIDIGKSTTTAMVSNLSAETLARAEQSTPELLTPESYAAWAIRVVEATLALVQDCPPLCGIGVALPGLIHSPAAVSGAISHEPEMHGGGIETSVMTALQQKFGVEVLVENDARLMVPGNRWFGEMANLQNFAVLNIGIGLGLGISLNGRLLSGAQGFAGEIGHIPLGRPDVACSCGSFGCLENTASGGAISAMARERGLATDKVDELAELARAGNQAAAEIFKTFGEALGRGVATIINLFNPEAILLTGRVSRASDVFWETMSETVARHTLPAALENVQLVVEPPEKNFSLLGAVAAVLHGIFYSSKVSFEEVI